MKRILSWILLGFMGLNLLSAQGFSAFVDRNKVQVGGNFQVSFRLDNVQRQPIDYPDFKDFQVLSGPNVNQAFSMTNGRTSQSITFSFILRAVKEGKFSIGAASTEINGKKIKTTPIKVEVVKGAAPAPNGSNPNAAQNQSNQNAVSKDIEAQIKEAIFLRTIVSRKNVYQGEQITVTYKLYNQVQPYELELKKAPNYDGFWKENVKVPDSPQKIEVYQGKQYRTRVIYQDIIFPQRSGKLTIDPLELSCVVQVQTQDRRRRRSIFDDFFPSYQNYPYKFGGSKVTIDVKALPSNKPADFSGVVGKLNMDVSVDKEASQTGDPITMRVKISGTGNMRKLAEPAISFPPDFEVYDPNIKETNTRAGGILGGSKTYEYLVIPSNPGEFNIPPVTLSYFDPEKKRYQNISSSSYQLAITGDPIASASSPSGGASKQELELLEEDIRFIDTGSGLALTQEESSFAASGMHWGMYGTPFALLLLLIGFKRRKEEQDADVVGTKRKKATKVALKRLKGAKAHLTANEHKAFYDEVSRAIWGYLGDKLNIDPSEQSRDLASKELSQRQVQPETITVLNQTLDTCEMALFAPSAVGQNMQESYDQALKLISDLEDEISA